MGLRGRGALVDNICSNIRRGETTLTQPLHSTLPLRPYRPHKAHPAKRRRMTERPPMV
jgi:hypothetical protein